MTPKVAVRLGMSLEGTAAITCPIRSEKASILCIGDDIDLLQTRRLVLLSRGYRVKACTATDVFNRPAPLHMDAVILCHSISEHQFPEVLQRLEESIPRERILLIKPLNGLSLMYGAQYATAASWPMELLQSVSRMLSASTQQQPT